MISYVFCEYPQINLKVGGYTAAIANVLIGMCTLSKAKLIVALAFTGIGVVAGLLAIGLDYVTRKIAQGEGALLSGKNA
jgi:hypothetical protein